MSTPLIVAHRGCRSSHPENTVASLKAALAATTSFDSISGIEFDIELTKDNIPIVVHQETLCPTPDATALQHADRDSGTTWVNDSSWEQLAHLDAGSWFDTSFTSEKIPLLEEILKLEWGSALCMMELKDAHYWEGRNEPYEQRLLDAVFAQRAHFPSRSALLSFNEHLLIQARQRGFQGKVVFNVWHDREHQLEEVVALASEMQAEVVDFAEDMVRRNPQIVSAIRSLGAELFVYEVTPARNEPEFKNWTPASRQAAWTELINLGVDGIITDFPLELASYIEKNTTDSAY